MGIAHIDDLPVSEFMDTVESLNKMQATEKLDGANLVFGIDSETDRLFTSREGKRTGSVRYFEAEDYPYFGGTNPFRAAHIALKAVESQIREVMHRGQTVEIEVLFGRQPNAIVYGLDSKSFIAFLRGVQGTSDEVSIGLTHILSGKSVDIKTSVVASEDGENVDVKELDVQFQFIGSQPVDLSTIITTPELGTALTEFNNFLNSPAIGLPESMASVTNGELAEMNMGSVKKDIRESVKAIKEALLAKIQRNYKLPIKGILLNGLAKIKSKLSTSDITQDEDIGIEGVVIRDPNTGNLVKIVDKAAFTAINSFNHTIRGQINNTVRTIDPTAPLESRGGIVGHMKTQIAKSLGLPELAKSGGAKKIFKELGETDPVKAIKALTDTLHVGDFQGVKRKLDAVVKQALVDLSTLRERFKQEKSDYRLILSSGKEIGISPEVEKRTMLAFAETTRNVKELLKKIEDSNSIGVLLALMYGYAIPDSTEGDNLVAESVLVEKRYETDPARYSNKDAWTLLNIYFATVLMSVMMYKENDKIGLRILKDKTHFRLQRWTKEMSPLNFWGYPIWRCNMPFVKKYIGVKNSQLLNKVVKRVPPAWFKFLHMDLSFGRDVPINWVDHYKTMKTLQQFHGMNVDRVNTLLKGVFNFENLTYDQKVKVLEKLYYYVNQFIPYSPLFIRLKAIQRNVLFSGGDKDSNMLITELTDPLIRIKETADSGSTVAASTNTNPGVLFAKKDSTKPNIVKRKRNPDIKFLKFKKPENSAI